MIATSGDGMELTTSQAVQRYGVFPNVLHRMILMGRLAARKNADGRWLISKESLERWDRQRARKATKRAKAAIS
jgi:predicted site-specific integrase-resolvase